MPSKKLIQCMKSTDLSTVNEPSMDWKSITWNLSA
eukprot:CAMPEP_0170061774 /NCGR_PEP_ID=MMETSP0019_2-20121128/3225_1 /TAXON_ID=98059 /ORGANISM="Dinobryon sp., Strain UTEXLB2267" /LENGTH=34 /DNA_ID= /DNA_START= /DNA_END= /DNA_ORIENTATION=